MSTESNRQIEQAASAWLIRRDSGCWTEADQALFEQWLQASTLNRVAYLRLELSWEEARRLQALGAGIQGDDPPPPGQWNLTPFFDAGQGLQTDSSAREERRNMDKRVAAMAAAALLGLAGAWALWSEATSYVTPVGGTASVPMEDGSKITLNTDSRVRIALTDRERRVHLKQGEAYFEVAPDEQRPFLVKVGQHRVVVLGTRFAVRKDPDLIQVIVTEGRVRLVDGEAGDSPVVAAGQIARVTAALIAVEPITASKAEERLAWRSGMLMFREQPLAEAVAEFNRYNVRKLILADPAVGAMKVEGHFRATNVDGFARLLEEAYPVKVERQAHNRWLIRPVDPR